MARFDDVTVWAIVIATIVLLLIFGCAIGQSSISVFRIDPDPEIQYQSTD